MNMRNSQSQASPASSFPEEGHSALDGSEPATEDEIRELQQIEDFSRRHHCLPENYRPLSEDADVSTTLRKETELDDWANSWDAFRSSPITSAWLHTGRFAAMTARISWPLGPSTLISLRKPTVPIPQAVPVRQTVQRKSNDSRYLA